MSLRVVASPDRLERLDFARSTTRPAPPVAAEVAASPYLATTGTALALLGAATYWVGMLFTLTRILSPAVFTTAIAAIRALPPVSLALLTILLVSVAMFQVALGLWLIVKGVHISRNSRRAT